MVREQPLIPDAHGRQIAGRQTPPETHTGALLRLSQIVNSSLDAQKVFYRTAEEIHQLLGAQWVALVLLDQAGEWRCGFSLEFAAPVRWQNLEEQFLRTSLAGRALAQNQLTRVRAEPKEQTFEYERRLLAQGYEECCYLPLVCRAEVIGVLGLASCEQDAGNWSASRLTEIATVVATAMDNVRAYAEIRDLKKRLQSENVFLRDEIKSGSGTEIIGGSAALEGVRRAVEQVAATDSTVLIAGETGTGKELIALMNYHWPGNIRELEHIIERGVIVSRGPALDVDPSWLRVPTKSGSSVPAGQSLAVVERQTILKALNECGGKIYGSNGAAARLGLKPTTLYSRMRKYNIVRTAKSNPFE